MKDNSDRKFRFEYPRRPSEFEVQAQLFHELKTRGYDVRGEVLAQAPCKIGATRKTIFRFDLVIFKNRQPALIIEVKRKHKRKGLRKQMRSYATVGVPVVPCVGEREIQNVVNFLRANE